MWERHDRYTADGTYDRIHARLVAEADAAGDLDWMVSVDSTAARAHQHDTDTKPAQRPSTGLTGGRKYYMFSAVGPVLSPSITLSAAPAAG